MANYKHILTDFKDLRKVIGEITKEQPAKSRYQQQAEKMQYTTEESKYVKAARDVVKKKSAKKIEGVILDLFTASAIVQVYDAVNQQNKKKMDGLKMHQLASIAFKLAGAKKRGSGVRKEGVFDEALEKVLANESDLGLTYKKGKTVQVTHKTSGKELIIIDKPSVRKEYEKIGYYAEEVDLDEVKYKIKNGKVYISKKEFAKVSKDYKGKNTMTVLDPKTRSTVNMPVVFEEVDLDEWKLGDGRPRGASHIENIRFWDLPKDQLEYIKKDSNKAIKANPKNPKNTRGKGNYADQINDADTVLAWRKKKGIKEEVGLEEAVSHNRLNTIQKDSVKALFRAVNQADGVKDRTAVAQSSKEMEKGTRAFQLHFYSQNPDVQEVIAKAINKVMKKSEMFIIWDAKFSKQVASFGEEISEGRMKDLSLNIAHVYKQMKKDSVMKPFADKFKADATKTYDIYKSLEKVLPDYVSGGKITALMKGVKDEVIPSRSKQVKEEHEHAKQSPFKLKSQQYPRAVAVETDGYGKRHATVEDIISACDSFGMIIDKELQVEQVQKQLGKKGFITYKKSELEDIFESRETERIILVLESELEEQSPTEYTKDQIQNALDEGHEIEFLKPDGKKTVGPVLKLSGNTFNVKDKYTGKSFTYKYSKIEEEKVKTFNEVSTQVDEGREKGPKQLTNPNKEVMVVKKNKVIVISKKDQDKYLKQGWSLAEGSLKEVSKYLKYSDLLVKKAREVEKSGPNSPAVKAINKEIDKEQKKLGIKEDANLGSKKDAMNTWLPEGDKEAYQKFFNATLKKFGVSSPDELEGKKKKEFFDYIDKNWTADHEEVDIHKSYRIDGRRANFREKMRKLGYIKSRY